MNKLLFTLAIMCIIATSCEESEPVPEIFTFTLNGEEMDFSDNIQIVKNIFGEVMLTGKKTGVGMLSITIKDDKTGIFNESDNNFNSETFISDYDMSYKDGNDNFFSYYSSSVNSYFTISIKNFENSTSGELSGTFDGLLEGSILNDDGLIDSVVIKNGIFSTELTSRVEF